ncbi:MAG: hypothetical protein OEL20_05095 [Sulfuritalea sp.]|nr:hypothetical protein [Sulfuritalea sp.]
MTTPQSPPTFQQCLDPARPHTLLTEDTRRSGTLPYFYDDTQERVAVPNVWYNQTFQTRVATVRWNAMRVFERAAQIQRSPPYGLTPAAAADIARRYRARGERMRTEADRMEAAGRALHPVAASHLPLNYGDNVH